MVVLVTSANIDDGTGAPEVLRRLSEEHQRRLDEIHGDSKYNSRTLNRYLEQSQAKFKITVMERPKNAEGLVHCHIVGLSNAPTPGMGKYRRNSKDYERTTSSAEAMTKVSSIHLMLNRLRPDPNTKVAKFTYPRRPMKKAA